MLLTGGMPRRRSPLLSTFLDPGWAAVHEPRQFPLAAPCIHTMSRYGVRYTGAQYSEQMSSTTAL